jgi:hypothetical protein
MSDHAGVSRDAEIDHVLVDQETAAGLRYALQRAREAAPAPMPTRGRRGRQERNGAVGTSRIHPPERSTP